MKQLWGRYAERFEALNLRERILIAITLLVTIVLVGYVAFIEPQGKRQKITELRLAQQRVELTDLQQKAATTRSAVKDKDAATRNALERSRQQIAEASSQLKAIEQTLVPPGRVAGFLEDILKRNSRIQLVSLQTLPGISLLERKSGPDTGDRLNPGAAKAADVLKHQDAAHRNVTELRGVVDGGLFKHGVEITVTGTYSDLMNYLADLEKMSQKVLWNSVTLTVEDHPRARMTLTVYTLSLDRAWLTV